MNSNNPLGNQPVGKMLVRLSIPSFLAQLISLLYSIVDRIYISHIPNAGAGALAGVGITVPILIAVNSFAQLIGMGGGPLISISLGEKNKARAEKIQWVCLVTSTVISIALTLVLLLFRFPILKLFGTDESIISYAYDYYTICCLGSFFSIGTMVINALLRTQGLNKYSMIIVCAGAVFNIIFDPIFIFILGLGIKGAALITVVSQIGTCIAGFIILAGKKSSVKVIPSAFDFKILSNILSLGFASFFMSITESLLNTVFNKQLIRYGSIEYVAILSIIYSLVELIQLPMTGISQGSQPLLSYNYGAKNKTRLIQAIKYSAVSITLFCFIGTLIFEAACPILFRLFTTDNSLIEMGVPVMRIFILGRLFSGVQFSIQNIFRSLGDVKRPIIVAMTRKIILLIPLIYILPAITGAGPVSIFAAEPVSDICSQTLAVLIFIPYYRKHVSTL